MFLCIYRKIVHERILRVRSWSVAVRCERRILIIFSLSDVSVGLPLHSGLERALLVVPPLVPVVLEGSGKIQFLRIRDLKNLREKFPELSDFEAQERINFYSEMIDDRIEEGLSEEDAISAIGSVDSITSEVLEEMVIEEMSKAPSEEESVPPSAPIVKDAKKKLSATQITLLAVGSPLWIVLAVTAFAVILSVAVSLWAVVVSLWAVTLALAVCGVGGLIAGIVLMFAKGYVGVMVIACALVAGGLAIFFYYGVLALTKWFAGVTAKSALAIAGYFKRGEIK